MNIRLIRSTIIMALCTCSLSTYAICQFSGYQASYTFYGKNMKSLGTHTETLELINPNQFIMKGESHLQVLWFKENLQTTIKGNYANGDFTPKTYHFHETRKNTTVQFSIPKGWYDPTSYVLNIRSALINKKQQKMQFKIKLDDKGKQSLLTASLTSLPQQTVSTALGKLSTVMVSVNDNTGITTHYWMAPKYQYLPVEIAAYKSGKLIFMDRVQSWTASNSTYCAIKN